MQEGAFAGNVTLVGNRIVYDWLGKTEWFDRFVEAMDSELKQFCVASRGTSLWPVVKLGNLSYAEVMSMLQSRVKVEFESGIDGSTTVSNRNLSLSYAFFHFDDPRNNENQWTNMYPYIPLKDPFYTNMTLLETLLLLLVCDSTVGCDIKRVFRGRQFLVCGGSIYPNNSIPSVHINGNGLLFSCYNPDSVKQNSIQKSHVVQIVVPRNVVLDHH